MIIFPAIDMLDGNCVRLVRGEYGTASRVAEDALETALKFESAGAAHLHLVDLDGAKNGEGSDKNRKAVSEIAKKTNLFTELGGGIRTLDDIKRVFDCGVDRAILGSAATDLEFLKKAVALFGDRIAVGIDAKNGKVAVSGWLKTVDLDYIDFAREVSDAGVKTVIFTDISKDGTLSGPALPMLCELKENIKSDITASGGIKDIGDIIKLRDCGLYGAICGKSLYAGTLDLTEALNACKTDNPLS